MEEKCDELVTWTKFKMYGTQEIPLVGEYGMMPTTIKHDLVSGDD
jgi:hypothetical protein